jgi:L-fuculose-phosphate aldolase
MVDPKADLIRHYRWLRQFGLNDSHSGNASIRDGDAVWVTPTGACADTLEVEELIRCQIGGSPGAGASLDAPLHVAVLEANPSARVVLHSHGPYTVAMTLDGEDYLPPDFEGQYYFGQVPVLNIAYADYLDESPRRVARELMRSPIVVVRGHGVYAQADSVNLAYKWTCSLELSAKTAYLARQAGKI